MSEMAHIRHAYYCFSVLEAHLDPNRAVNPLKPIELFADESFPLFVTWNSHDDPKFSTKGKLRGCIGNFSPLSLHSGLKEYSLIAALHDSRFPPIRFEELENLSCSVSFLVNFQKKEHYTDWTLGQDGLWISFPKPFSDKNGTATFLPEVAVEQGWTKLKTIDNLLYKGGCKPELVSEKLRRSIQLTTYQSSKVTCTFSEYKSWRADYEKSN